MSATSVLWHCEMWPYYHLRLNNPQEGPTVRFLMTKYDWVRYLWLSRQNLSEPVWIWTCDSTDVCEHFAAVLPSCHTSCIFLRVLKLIYIQYLLFYKYENFILPKRNRLKRFLYIVSNHYHIDNKWLTV